MGVHNEDAGCSHPCGEEPWGCRLCGEVTDRLPDGVDDYFETHYEDDLLEWETEQVFQDHEGWEDEYED